MDAAGQKQVLRASLAWVLPFAIANFVIAPLASEVGPDDVGAVFVFLCAGVIGAEGALHAIWCVLAPVRFAKRLAIGVAVGLGLYGAWALGYAVSISEYPYYRDHYWEQVLTGLLLLPLLAIAIQSPLWLARIWLGWRVEHRAGPFRGSDVGPFRIRHLLGATGALALALSAVRLAAPEDVPSEEEFLVVVAIAALVAAAVSLFTTLPAVAATLRGRRALRTLPAILLFDSATPIFIVVILSLVFRDWPPWENFVGVVALGIGFFVGLVGVLLVVRALGYRLAWGRRKTTPGDEILATSG